MNSLGRRPLLLVGSLVTGLAMLVLSILTFIDSSSLSFLSVGMIFFYYLCFNVSLGPIVWLYCSEILPSKGISIATMVNWLSGTIIVFAVPYLSLKFLFTFYTSICFACVIFCFFFLQETKGKNKIEIAQMFAPKNLGEENDSALSEDK